MTLEKAIEILTIYMKSSDEAEPMDFDSAVKLGIEAMKRIKYLQGIALYRTDTILPGETKV